MKGQWIRRLVPHMSFFTVLIAVAIIGLANNIHAIAVFIGRFAAVCTDPLVLVVSAAIGAVSNSMRFLLGGTVVFGALVSVYIARLNEPLGAELTLFGTFTRTSAVIGIALAANAIRLLFVRDGRIRGSDGL